ncbi:MAG: leucine-rich repeat domain-containing protein [Clostridia bacterium]|nr:leucine-rich repeat domain-containing protein [Clostridia bacterium]
MLDRLPAWIKNKWALYGLSCAATLLAGLLFFLLFLRGPFASVLTKQGAKALEEKDYGKAAAKYATALSLKKNREAIYLGYGRALIGLEDSEGAIAVLEKGIDRFGGAEELYLCKVQAMVADGAIGDAVDFLANIDNSYINKSIQAARPGDLTYSPSMGKYSRAQKVTLTQRPGETIYYTLNGTDPTMNSAIYKEPITVSTTSTLTAIAVSEDGLVSPRLRLEYEINNAHEAIQFTDDKIEQMVRISLGRPSGSIYAAQLLSVTDLVSTDAEGSIRSLKDLEYMPSLRSLWITDELLIEDYAPLAGLSELKILCLSGCALSDRDLTHLSGLTELTELTLNNNRLTTLQPLRKLTALEFLNVSDNELSSTDTLAEFSSLKWLYLAQNSILNLDGISTLTELQGLNVSGNYISDLSPLTGLTKLTELHLRGNAPKNLKKLSTLPALAYVDVSGCDLASLSVFNDYKALSCLYAADNRIASLSTFKGALTELSVSGNPLVDISPLSSQGKLKILEAANTQITDISCLSTMNELTYLDISGTPVTDATCLKSLPKLSYLICTEKCSTAGLPESLNVVIA